MHENQVQLSDMEVRSNISSVKYEIKLFIRSLFRITYIEKKTTLRLRMTLK